MSFLKKNIFVNVTIKIFCKAKLTNLVKSFDTEIKHCIFRPRAFNYCQKEKL